MRLLLLPLAGVIAFAIGCDPGSDPLPDSTSSTGGQGGTVATGPGSSGAAGALAGGGGVATGGGNAGSAQDMSGAGPGGSSNGGTQSGGAGAASGGGNAGGSSSGAGGGNSAGSGGAASYEPIKGAKYDELPIFEGNPPNFKAGAPAETVNAQGSIGNVSVPTLRRYPMDASKATGYGYIVFPGGAYTGLDFETHATRLAERVGPLGIAVFGLKYRVGGGTNDAKRDALLDAKRAVRLVRHNAARWGVVTQHVGVIGYSAGSHLALNLAGAFDAGNPNASDAVEKQSSRPAFVGSMSTWADYKPESPFTFPNDVPPTYFCHAEDDGVAPIALARTVEGQIRAKNAATKLDFYPTGGHSTCHPGDASMPGHDWPNKFWPWIQPLLP
jgi:acetyl esterase/lipase